MKCKPCGSTKVVMECEHIFNVYVDLKTKEGMIEDDYRHDVIFGTIRCQDCGEDRNDLAVDPYDIYQMAV